MAGTVAPTVPSRRSGRPAVRSGRSRSSGNPQLCAWPWASPVFCQQFLHRRHVQHLIRHDPLELGILDLQLPQPLGLGCIHATVLLPPGIERGGADPVAPTDVVRLGAGLAFLKHADDLLFSETLPLHGSSSFSNSKVEDSSSQWPGYRGEGQEDDSTRDDRFVAGRRTSSLAIQPVAMTTSSAPSPDTPPASARLLRWKVTPATPHSSNRQEMIDSISQPRSSRDGKSPSFFPHPVARRSRFVSISSRICQYSRFRHRSRHPAEAFRECRNTPGHTARYYGLRDISLLPVRKWIVRQLKSKRHRLVALMVDKSC